MTRIVSELIVSLDNCARGMKSPAYYGYSGPEFDSWLEVNNAEPHRNLMGRKTYELLNALPDEAQDDQWRKITQQPGYLYSRTLRECNWPGLELVNGDMIEHVRSLKSDEGSELRVVGSISVMRQLVDTQLLDILRLTVCPLALPKTGVERIFDGLPDVGFSLAAHRVLDSRVLILDYAPAGAPPNVAATYPAAK